MLELIPPLLKITAQLLQHNLRERKLERKNAREPLSNSRTQYGNMAAIRGSRILALPAGGEIGGRGGTVKNNISLKTSWRTKHLY